ncbi:hypothetical protein [Paraburkholderia sacchari]|uniref:hypothetical protein n=1 Tax=Paraburkholderia sacchari TaxID=159450 RepID=UPI001BCD9A02|nr:hypothetical protein [Paraburkholderia sacchari]
MKLQPGITTDALYGNPEAAGPNAFMQFAGNASSPNAMPAGGMAGPNASFGPAIGLNDNPMNRLGMSGPPPQDAMGMDNHQNGPMTDRIVNNPNGGHDVYSYDAMGNLGAGKSFDANGNLRSSFAYDHNAQGRTLTNTNFNPDGSAQVDQIAGNQRSSYRISPDGQMQNWRQEPLTPTDAQRFAQWQALAGQLQMNGQNAGNPVAGAQGGNIAPESMTPMPSTSDIGDAGAGAAGGPQIAAPQMAAGPQPAQESGGAGGPQIVAPQMAAGPQPAPESGSEGGPQIAAPQMAAGPQPAPESGGAGGPQIAAPQMAAGPQPAPESGGAAPVGAGGPQIATPQTTSAPQPAPANAGGGMAAAGDNQGPDSKLSNMVSDVANALLPQIADGLKSLIGQLFGSAMQGAPGQSGASPATADQISPTAEAG